MECIQVSYKWARAVITRAVLSEDMPCQLDYAVTKVTRLMIYHALLQLPMRGLFYLFASR